MPIQLQPTQKGRLMSEELTLDVWRTRLEVRGHPVTGLEGETGKGFDVWPDATTIVTVAVEPDGTLYRPYRERFFLCEPEPERVFHVTGCPEPHRNRWLSLVDRQPPGYWRDFLAGPGAWTLSRLSRFQEVVAWAGRGLAWASLDDPIHRGWGMELPAEAAPLFPAPCDPDPYRPLGLRADDGRFADAIAACFLFASVAMHDCYLADVAGTEVYLAHHHEKVVVSIPDAEVRAELVQGLAAAPWLFADVSGFASTIDEEDENGEDEEQCET
jgi:hypothetical protein